MLKTCVVCGKPFLTLNDRHMYCSSFCYKLEHNKKLRVVHASKTCVVCGGTFVAINRRQTCCCTTCRKLRNGVKTPVDKVCAWCGKPFPTTKRNRTYCCKHCYVEAKRLRDRERTTQEKKGSNGTVS